MFKTSSQKMRSRSQTSCITRRGQRYAELQAPLTFSFGSALQNTTFSFTRLPLSRGASFPVRNGGICCVFGLALWIPPFPITFPLRELL